MKRKTRSYLVTHIHYNAILRAPSRLRPLLLKDKLILLFFFMAALFFIHGVSAAQPAWLPSDPSSNFNTFKKQLVFTNINRVVNQIKASSSDIRQANALFTATQDVKTTLKPRLGVTAKLGIQPNRGLIYSEVGFPSYKLINRIDAISKQYEFSLGFSNYTIAYSFPFNTNSWRLFLTTSWKIE